MALEVKSSNPFTHPILFSLGYRQAVRHETLTFALRWFESSYPTQLIIIPIIYIGVSPSGKATDSDSVIP